MNKLKYRRISAFLLIGAGLFTLLIALPYLSGSLPAVAQDGTGDDEPPATPEPTGDNSYCLVCHQDTDETLTLADGTTLVLDITDEETASFSHSIHTIEQTGVGCVDCHGDNAFPHVGSLPTTFSAYVNQYTDACLDCHGEQQEGDFVRTIQFENIGQSELLAGTVCTDCHQTEEEWQEIHDVNLSSFNVEVEGCTECHATTVMEWRNSAHGDQQLACATCHIPHEERLRFPTVDAQCLNCHDETRSDFTHLNHAEQECSDCHWYRGENTAQHILTSGTISETGHDNLVETQACISCHTAQDYPVAIAEADTGEEEAPPDDDAEATGDETDDVAQEGEAQEDEDEEGEEDEFAENHPFVQAREQIETLENQVEEERTEAEEQSAVRLIQGVLVGLALGAIVTVVSVRYLRLPSPSGKEEEETPQSH
jgi:hypothetical protein